MDALSIVLKNPEMVCVKLNFVEKTIFPLVNGDVFPRLIL